MKKKPPKISYRDLLAGSTGAPRTPAIGVPAQSPLPPRAAATVDEPVIDVATLQSSRGRSAPGSLNAFAAALNAGRESSAPSLVELTDDTEPVARRVAGSPLRDRVRARNGSADLLLFRVGRERFAVDLALVEEAVELPAVHVVPESRASLLGVFRLRGQLTPVYSPAAVLGVALETAASALVLRSGEHRLGLAVDDVEDVLRVDLATVRDVPGVGDDDGVLIGVARVDRWLLALLDAEALIAACRADQPLETA